MDQKSQLRQSIYGVNARDMGVSSNLSSATVLPIWHSTDTTPTAPAYASSGSEISASDIGFSPGHTSRPEISAEDGLYMHLFLSQSLSAMQPCEVGPAAETTYSANTHPSIMPLFITNTSPCKCGCGGLSVPRDDFRDAKWKTVDGTQMERFIRFSVNNQCGISAADAFARRFSGLDGRDDRVFVDAGCKTSIAIRIKMPGYKQWRATIRTVGCQSPSPKPITLSTLAYQIAKRLQEFLNEKQHDTFDETQDPVWRIGPGQIVLDKFILVGLERVSQGSWTPHFRLWG